MKVTSAGIVTSAISSDEGGNIAIEQDWGVDFKDLQTAGIDGDVTGP